MRCVPICFGVDVKDDFPIFFGCFYKFSYYCIKNNWPIIAQSEYFVKASLYEKKYPINLKSISSINEIPNIKKIEIDKIDKYVISDEETNRVLTNYKNKDEAWISLMNIRDDSLYRILDIQLQKITKKYDDIYALIVWRHNETISLIAKKYGLKVIEMELSGVRKPSYNFGLSYFQYSNKYSTAELNERYERFIKEIKNKKIPLLQRSKLIKLLVSKKEIDNMSTSEEYDFGVALGLRNDYDTKSTKSIINSEILKQILKIENGSNVLVRKHPANYNYKYELEDKFIIDKSVSSIQFLSKCRRIVSSVSNIGFESMLFGKTSYTLGEMPFKRFCYNSLEYNDDYIISITDLNYLVFGYYVPYDLALEQEYVEFRSNNPSEYDIYMYHYNYIMSHHKINNSVKVNGVRDKNIKQSEYIKSIKEEIKNLQDENKKLQMENDRINNELNAVYNSKSWKITKPLRFLKKKS